MQVFTNIQESQNCSAWGRVFINSSLPLPPASRALTNQPGDYCRGLASAHSQHPDSNWEPLVSEPKSLTTTLRALKLFYGTFWFVPINYNLYEKTVLGTFVYLFVCETKTTKVILAATRLVCERPIFEKYQHGDIHTSCTKICFRENQI